MVQLLTLPILMLNGLGSIVGFIWLAILGEWGHIFGGIAAACVMPFAFGVLQVPSLPLIPLTDSFANKRRFTAATVALFLSALWTSILMTAWCVFVFFTSLADLNYQNTFPIMVWGYAIAMAPIGYMARQEGNPMSGANSFTQQVFYCLLLLCFILKLPREAVYGAIGLNLFAWPILSAAVGYETLKRGY